MRPLARRLDRLGTETAFEVAAKARALEATGRSIVHLEIGEPDFDSPAAVVAEGIAALRRGETHYTGSAGIPELRGAIAMYLKRTRGLEIDPAQVIVTPGAKPIMWTRYSGAACILTTSSEESPRSRATSSRSGPYVPP